MEIINGPVLCHSIVAAKVTGVNSDALKSPFLKVGSIGSGYLSLTAKCRIGTVVAGLPIEHSRRNRLQVCHSYSSSSDGNGSMAGNFHESDEDFVNSSVIEAVEARNGSDGFVIKMRDGKSLRCVQSNPQGLSLATFSPTPAIVLKMEDGSGLLLPILVLEEPRLMLMAAVLNVQIARPTIYNVVKEMTEKMGYVVQLARVTKRVQESYFAQLYLTKVGNEKETLTFDLRPSDAINMAVRCKVPIQVNRHLVYNNGMKVVETPKASGNYSHSNALALTRLDRPDDQPCFEAQEFDLVRNMLIAVVEERYKDAAQYRDQLFTLRAKRKSRA